MHKEEKLFVPTLIFGHLLTSSNYDDTEKKVVGGRNGFGAKLCNIFSTKFTVETACNGKKFKQVDIINFYFIFITWHYYISYVIITVLVGMLFCAGLEK